MTLLDLSPAKWLWLPGERTLPNTAVIFKKRINITEPIDKAEGFIFADSRYLIHVNGNRVQWGPAPADPRYPEIDPINIKAYLKPGENEITVYALWFGYGEGTYVPSNPGFIFRLQLNNDLLVSDETWKVAVDYTLQPGGHQQWYLRALQEKRDLRMTSWEWMIPAVLQVAPDKPTLCGPTFPGGPQSLNDSENVLRKRMIPLLQENDMEDGFEFVEAGLVNWKLSCEYWFDFRIKDSFTIDTVPMNRENIPVVNEMQGVFLTWKLPEEAIGWPGVIIDAPEGTVVEMIYQESHDEDSSPWLESHYYNWSRFICREGENLLEPFDFYAMRWLQIHIHGHVRPVSVRTPNFRRRSYLFSNQPQISCSDISLQRLFDANINTVYISLQEGNYDGCGRERQQYSGDCGHQQHVSRLLFGEYGHGARYLRTYSDGQSQEGWFMDCWPGSDRLARIGQRQLGATDWGPLLDHGVGFVFDCFNHYMESGRLKDIEAIIPRLIKFGLYLLEERDATGLVRAEHELRGTTSIWLDHDAWIEQKHKTCCFSLYAAAMYHHALSPMCRSIGRSEDADVFENASNEIVEAVRKQFWSPEHGVYIDNLPWAEIEGVYRLSDRTLATAILYDFLGEEFRERTIDYLAESIHPEFDMPVSLGWSYPPNAVWRHWALFHGGRGERVIELLRQQWAVFPSVINNNTLAEGWVHRTDSMDQWSHCAVAPLVDLVQGVAGIYPLKPGFESMVIRPQPGDLENLALTIHTPFGKILFTIEQKSETERLLCYTLPLDIDYRLNVAENNQIKIMQNENAVIIEIS